MKALIYAFISLIINYSSWSSSYTISPPLEIDEKDEDTKFPELNNISVPQFILSHKETCSYIPSTLKKEQEDDHWKSYSEPNSRNEAKYYSILSKVKNAGEWPFCAHGLVIVKHTGQETIYGSGVLIGPRHVLTASHVIKLTNKWPTSIQFVTSHTDNNSSQGKNWAVHAIVGKDEKNEEWYYNDYALLILKRNLGLITGWYSLKYIEDKEIMYTPVNITGYIKDNVMHNSCGRVSGIHKEYLDYYLDTEVGMGGSGIWLPDNKGCTLVGIHTLGGEHGSEIRPNAGIRLTQRKIANIISWILDENSTIKKSNAEKANDEFKLGLAYANGKDRQIAKDDSQAIKHYRIAAQMDHAGAQNNLGFMLANGRGTAEDKSAALKWFKESAQQNNAQAYFNLGVMHAREGDFTNAVRQYALADLYGYSDAIKWIYKLALKDNTEAQYYLGVLILLEQEFKNAEEEAILWLNKAIEKRHTEAFFAAAAAYQSTDISQAAKLCMIAAEQGLPEAQYVLSIMLEEGIGIEKNLEISNKLCIRAAEHGLPEAQLTLSKKYEYGFGIPDMHKNLDLSAMWCQLAAEQGLAEAQYILGSKYQYGEGVVKNGELAALWSNKAASQDYEPAIFVVAALYKEVSPSSLLKHIRKEGGSRFNFTRKIMDFFLKGIEPCPQKQEKLKYTSEVVHYKTDYLGWLWSFLKKYK